ncbi:MAG: signal peptidase II [Firmicutes bacterium]|nr:signal peptidase II [Clostridiales bacterium]MBQ4339746.1 signal peptidase II [Bacillota bacterium]
MVYVVLIIIAASVAIDQALKSIVVNTLEIGQSLPLIEGVFHFTYIQNFGAAFSILQNKQAFLIIVTAVVMAIAAVVLFKNMNKLSKMIILSLAFIIGGGIGNLIDRIRLGYVVDFLDFTLINYPVFNFADCCVVVGSIVLVIGVFLEDRNEKKRGSRNG